MSADTFVLLDDLRFSRFEVPEHIPFGGKQTLAIHKMVGGKRKIDAMGRDDAPLTWSGLFLGELASQRARYLDFMRTTGQVRVLTWGEFAYSVVIENAMLDYRRAYEIPYTITCEIVENLTQPVSDAPPTPIDAAVMDDMFSMTALGDMIGDPTLSSLLGTLSSAVSAVSSFANAAQSTINTVLTPLLAVQRQVTLLIASAGSTMANVATVGGLLPNNPISQQVQRINAQISGYTQTPLLLNLQNIGGRMGTNLGSIGTSRNNFTTAGGNLFEMASKAYGDISAWTTLARANNLTDPVLVGVKTISVPPTPDDNGGVYRA